MLDRRSLLLAAAGSLATPFVRPSWAALPSFVVTKTTEALVPDDFNRVFDPRVVAHPDGGFLIAYSDMDGAVTVVRRFGGDGKEVGPAVKLAGFTQTGGCFVPAPGGPYLVRSGSDLIIRRLGWSGRPVQSKVLRGSLDQKWHFARAARLADGTLAVSFVSIRNGAWKALFKTWAPDLATSTPSVAIGKTLAGEEIEVNDVLPWLNGTTLTCVTSFSPDDPYGETTRVQVFSAAGPVGPSFTFPGDPYGSGPIADPGFVRLPRSRFALVVPRLHPKKKTFHVSGGIYDRTLRKIATLATIQTDPGTARQANAVPTAARYQDPGRIVCVLNSGLAVAWSSESGALLALEDVGFKSAVDLARLKDGSFASAFTDGPDGASVGCLALR